MRRPGTNRGSDGRVPASRARSSGVRYGEFTASQFNSICSDGGSDAPESRIAVVPDDRLDDVDDDGRNRGLFAEPPAPAAVAPT